MNTLTADGPTHVSQGPTFTSLAGRAPVPGPAKQQHYYADCNMPLLHAVPQNALRILEVGCGEGWLGANLKRMDPRRFVAGVELQPQVAEQAAKHLDRVFVLNIEEELPEIEPGSLDCILFDDVLEHLVNPGAVLERYKQLLAPSGRILCCIPNFQHYSMILALLAGDLQYTQTGILDSTHLRFFTLSTMQKLLLDAGYAPRLVRSIDVPAPAGLLQVTKPMLDVLGVNFQRATRYFQAYQYILEARPIPGWAGVPATEALSIVACVSNEAALRANLLASPDLHASAHELILLKNCKSAAEGLNRGLEAAKNPLVICVHQDVYLPKGWTGQLLRQYRQAERTFGPLGIAGVYGVAERGGVFSRAGHVVDRDNLLWEPEPLPARVSSLDELLLVAPKSTPVRFDPSLGFHFYGTDICLSAQARGLPAVVLDALCFHNSRTVGLNETFPLSAAVFYSKWKDQLPVATPCVRLTPQGKMVVW